MNTQTSTTPASPTKLRNGSWGAKTKGPVSVGDVVTITTRGGKSWDATVSEVVWTGEGVSIVATQSAPKTTAPRRQASRTGGSCRGCRGPIRDSPHHHAMGGYCGGCAFDEFDC